MIQLIWNNKTVALKSPEFGDSIGLNLGLVINRSMNGTVFTHTNVNAKKVLNFDFRKLSRIQVRNYMDFMAMSRGKNITLIDHTNIRWYGDITSQPVESSHEGINDSVLKIVFEGIQVA